jgi:hypothetical protein
MNLGAGLRQARERLRTGMTESIRGARRDDRDVRSHGTEPCASAAAIGAVMRDDERIGRECGTPE